ncbi:hypothetical protein [Planosporangium mesophilum]|uniref:Uncharacterized protein n=1 Tax=Planosporangium mesophilum TaxID=689768 RepID=A0A8J3T6N1_9ACTN|nr:hypothetical protein [Planosporangium mesophilum]NJC81499.1 hypothetical protein [Planosporangium mesophilum]GII20844.1 hypothetical protein Pme01_04410 [Planosporangium mesophilum]
MTRRPRCPDWCAGGHRCGLGEHRSDPISITIPGAGTAVLTRVRAADGTDHADIRLSAALPADEPAARLRLAALLTHLRTLIGPPRAARRAA